MKKLLLFAVTAVVLAGCQKNSSNLKPAAQATVIGKWYASLDTGKEYIGQQLNGGDTLSYNHTDYLLFNADNTGTSLTAGVSNDFTYTLSDTSLVINFPHYNPDTRTKPIPDIQICSIKQLSATNLTIYYTRTFGTDNITFRKTGHEYFVR